MTSPPDPERSAADSDSLGDLATAFAGQWRPVMAPLVRQLAAWIASRKSLENARDRLAGRLPHLKDDGFLRRIQNATFQARLVGLAGLAIYAQAGSAAFAEEAGRIELKPLTDVEAVRYLAAKNVGGRFSFDWRDVREEEHVSSFVVAKAMNASLLADIHQALTTAIGQGWSRDRFIAELTPTLQKAGWWGEQELTDPVTGERKLVQLGSARRLKTIFDVNIRQAHAAGRWERLVRSAQPGDMLRYTAVLDERTREQHRLWHGTTLPIEHPFWNDHYPPCGWNCRCTAILVTRGQLGRGVFKATSADELDAKGYGSTREWLNRRTGEIEDVPIGIDPGFAYNVGKARLAAFAPEEAFSPDVARGSLLPQQGRRPALPEPRPFNEPLLSPTASLESQEAALQRPFREALQGAGPGTKVYFDQAQVPLIIDRSLITDRFGVLKADKRGRGPYLPVIARTIADPDEIWVNLEAIYDRSGRQIGTTLRRRYIARWFTGLKQEAFLAVFEEDGGQWTGTTGYAAGAPLSLAKQLKQLDRSRVGVLIYRRVR